MGRKKTTSAAAAAEEVEGDPPVAVTKKNKKKGAVVVDDDEYMVVDQLDDDNSLSSTQQHSSANGKSSLPSEVEADLTLSFEELGLLQKKSKGKNVSKPEVDPEGSVADEETMAFSGKKKGKKGKKGLQIDDEEYNFSSVDDATSEQSTTSGQTQDSGVAVAEDSAALSKKKAKKGKKSGKTVQEEHDIDAEPDHDDMGSVLEEEIIAFTGKKKGKKGKKGLQIDVDEYDILAVDDATQTQSTASEQMHDTAVADSVLSSKKKQTKGQNNGKAAIEEDGVQDSFAELEGPKAVKPVEVTPSVIMHGLSREVSADSVELTESSIAHDNYEASNVLAKKKTKKGKKSGRTTQEQDDLFSILAELEEPEEPVPDAEEEAPYSRELEEIQAEDIVEFAGAKKKKTKKGKGEAKEKDLDVALAEFEGAKLPHEVVSLESPQVVSQQLSTEFTRSIAASDNLEDSHMSSKKKTKKAKKGGRTTQEEDDLDAILAELEGPKVGKPTESVSSEPLQAISQPVREESIEPSHGSGEAESFEVEEVVESAAAKKKKKKKEKEREKKAASEQAPTKATEDEKESSKGKLPEKKVPKHVREMQERLAKQKEVEEKRRQEEEEKRRKEEEEQLRLEELERQKEEAKRRRKEREKEKLLKKKQEGKLLTGKQKEEARRLALMRDQLLAQRGLPLDSDISTKEDVAAAPKKPKYESKKKRRPHGFEHVPSEEHVIEEQDDLMVVSNVEVPVEVEVSIEEEPEVEKLEEVQMHEEEAGEDEVEEDWDARSWDDEVSLPAIKSAFAEEEESEPTAKKITKRVAAQPPLEVPVARRPASPLKPASQPKTAIEQPNKQTQAKLEGTRDETESEDESESDEEDAGTKRRREAAVKKESRKAEALAKRSADNLRSPICCILGHVDTGKTKLLDCIRRTNVQEGEAGGITQQIGATYFPMENIRERIKELDTGASLRVPGLLVIDTPGHESFTNLRARGSSLCDIAILVIDIMHGLEPQTIESLNLLKMRHTPFVVALNKVDRLYSWKSCPNAPISTALKEQSQDVGREFQTRLNQIITQLKEQGMNSEIYFNNKELRKYVSIVPTSAISGEGIPDLLLLLVQLTQKMMRDKLMYISEVQCTVLEVKVIEGLGTTIDVVLVNGVLHEGDQIVVCGMQGPIVTNIRALLTPHPMKELRVKGTYQHHKELKAAQGIKITAQGLEHAIAGTQLHVVGLDDDLEDVKEEAMQDMKNVMSRIDKSGEGVCVQASTLGSLEALLEFLKSPAVQIPVSGISIGPVHKRDVMRASVMLERKKKEYATILAFDVKVTPEAKELAEELGVKIFMADIIYHLFDQFTAYMNNIKEEKKKEVADEAVFPCVLKILPQCIFNKKDPIILGVDVLEGVAKVGTPLCVPSREDIDIGRIFSMEVNHKIVDTAKKGQAVAMKILGSSPEEMQKMYGRHFDHEDELVSHITRRSIDVLKESYRDELSMEEWRLLVKLKKLFNIP